MVLLFLIDSIPPSLISILLLSYIHSLKECTYTFLLLFMWMFMWEGALGGVHCTFAYIQRSEVDSRCLPQSFIHLILLR